MIYLATENKWTSPFEAIAWLFAICHNMYQLDAISLPWQRVYKIWDYFHCGRLLFSFVNPKITHKVGTNKSWSHFTTNTLIFVSFFLFIDSSLHPHTFFRLARHAATAVVCGVTTCITTHFQLNCPLVDFLLNFFFEFIKRMISIIKLLCPTLCILLFCGPSQLI